MSSVLDFGARGDGVTDDGPAIRRALQHAMDREVVVDVPSADYIVATPIVAEATKNVVQVWGLRGGGYIRSGLPAGSNLITIMSGGKVVRNMTIEGLHLEGVSRQGRGLVCQSVGGSISASVIRDVIVSNCTDGITLEGNVFETSLIAPRMIDCSGGGLVLRTMSQRDVCSGITVFGLNAAQCGMGAMVIGPQGTYGAPQDTKFFGGYVRNSQRYGIYLWGGGKLYGTNLENNYQQAPDDVIAAHIYSYGPRLIANGVEAGGSNDCRYLFRLRGERNHSQTIRDCAKPGALLRNEGTAFVIVDECGEGAADGNPLGYRVIRGAQV